MADVHAACSSADCGSSWSIAQSERAACLRMAGETSEQPREISLSCEPLTCMPLARAHASIACSAARRTAGRSSTHRCWSSAPMVGSDEAASTCAPEEEDLLSARGEPTGPPPLDASSTAGGIIAPGGGGIIGETAAAAAGTGTGTGIWTWRSSRWPGSACSLTSSTATQPRLLVRTPGALSEMRWTSSFHRICGTPSAVSDVRLEEEEAAAASRAVEAISTERTRAPTLLVRE
mmetsp:Transcript_71783/g.173230  ORF Transcript_71783/g.173230 Transcript_71783/m.173230 type:complete len:234 (-) Transcript_71783:1061-1762(-)